MSEHRSDVSPVGVAPMAADELEEALPLFAGYQRFYGVDEPDDDRNRRFFARFLAPSEAGLLLRARTDDAMTGFACLYFTQLDQRRRRRPAVGPVRDPRGTRTRRGARAHRGLARGREGSWAAHLEWLTAIDNRTAQRLYEQFDAERSAWFGYEIHTGPG